MAITTNTPTVTGTVSAYTISPALPAGLGIDAKTGAIGGTPATVSAKAAYTVTATNPAGSTTAQVEIRVLSGPTTLVNLGHSSGIAALQTNGTRVLSEDGYGRWVLWNYATGDIINSGDGAVDLTSAIPYAPGIALAGQTMAIFDGTNVNIHSASDGRLTVTVPGNEWFKLATDGSYVVTGSRSGLIVYSAAGTLVFSHPGDYRSGQNVYAAPAQVQVERGNLIENIAVPSGSSTLTPLFAGTFRSWFTDGQRFLTGLADSILAYSANGVLEATLLHPLIPQALIGQGNWISIVTSTGVLQIYALGSTTPAREYTFSDPAPGVLVSGLQAAIFLHGSPEMSVIDLSGSSPIRTDYTLPSPLYHLPTWTWYNSGNFAANSASSWIMECNNSVIVDGTTLTSTPRLFNYGRALSIAAAANTAAIATESGRILIYDLATSEQKGTIRALATKLAISADGSVLAATDLSTVLSDGKINFYSLPSMTLIRTLSLSGLKDFSLSGSGSEVGLLSNLGNAELMRLDGSEGVTLAIGGERAPVLSPNGTFGAVSNIFPTTATWTTPQLTIFKDGQPVASPGGLAEGWIDNNHLLVAAYDWGSTSGYTYSHSEILDASGAMVTTFTFNNDQLPLIVDPSFIQSESVYDPVSNAIYSLTTANATFQGSEASPPVGAVRAAGASMIVYQSTKGIVRAEPFQ